MNNSKVLVAGATGLTGSHTVHLLLDRGRSVRVLAHREDKRSKRLQDLGAEVTIGDLLNLSDVRSALNGVQSAYFVYPLSPALVHATVIFAQAAKEAGVEIVANMSQWNSRPSAKSPATINHWLSERVFDWSAVPVAHLRATFFCEWLVWVARSIRQGVMTMPWDANSRFSPVAAEDLAHVIDGDSCVVICCPRCVLLGSNIHANYGCVRCGFKLAIGASIDSIDLNCGGSGRNLRRRDGGQRQCDQ